MPPGVEGCMKDEDFSPLTTKHRARCLAGSALDPVRFRAQSALRQSTSDSCSLPTSGEPAHFHHRSRPNRRGPGKLPSPGARHCRPQGDRRCSCRHAHLRSRRHSARWPAAGIHRAVACRGLPIYDRRTPAPRVASRRSQGARGALSLSAKLLAAHTSPYALFPIYKTLHILHQPEPLVYDAGQAPRL